MASRLWFTFLTSCYYLVDPVLDLKQGPIRAHCRSRAMASLISMVWWVCREFRTNVREESCWFHFSLSLFMRQQHIQSNYNCHVPTTWYRSHLRCWNFFKQSSRIAKYMKVSEASIKCECGYRKQRPLTRLAHRLFKLIWWHQSGRLLHKKIPIKDAIKYCLKKTNQKKNANHNNKKNGQMSKKDHKKHHKWNKNIRESARKSKC